MKIKYKIIPESVKDILRKTSFYKKRLTKNKTIIPYSEVDTILDEAPPLYLKEIIDAKPRIGIVRNKNVNFREGYVYPMASWLHYERFCKKNNIPYKFYDIYNSDWIEKSEELDIIVWHTPSNPSDQYIAESKIYILEKILNKSCFPSFHELWQYEDKCRAHYLYQSLDIASIHTTVTNCKKEAFSIITETGYPFITKTNIGAGSSGVEKIKSKKEAKQKVTKIFGRRGLKTQYPYQRQKDYFYVQEFIEDAKFDLRVMLIDDMAFGYYRYPKSGDYRASGSGIVEKKEIPLEALKLAIQVREKLQSRLMGVDMMFSKKHNKYLIIETSLFNQIDTAEQLVIDGIPGYYDISNIDNIVFKEGKFWIHELVLRKVINEWTINQINT